ncbi:F-box-like domain superfamily [Arabidopsis thaliana x Arabidopsis arenosa]|uniref:F-box-like domain superfamily n=1 Tax=Arabidopsis thaliana x Arabidopsis arenosa TaxID=1240361 RepID=A0A8T2C963_9BRAS|nr:F-box-like domain superfamily [Arabidopsis thaliana x Arabidopsis arenosa]
MNRGENFESIPNDLIVDIFSRVSSKSIGKCRCVSKLWRSMLLRPDFTELLLTKSSTRPRLFFVLKRHNDWCFCSSPQPQNPYEKSLVVAADSHTKFSKTDWQDLIGLTSGLIYISAMTIYRDEVRVICNPITGKYARLPKLMVKYTTTINIFGFDPIDKQFKVLVMNNIVCNGTLINILTLESGKMRWRKICCPLTHEVCCERICINGVLYYLGYKIDEESYVVACFDVRYEEFKFIDAKCIGRETRLINYKGKLGGIDWVKGGNRELCMWVLEDVEKQEWSKYVYTLPENEVLIDLYKYNVAGVTARGEIVLSRKFADIWSSQFYVFFFNPEKNTLQRVEIQGFEDEGREIYVYTFVDYVEDLTFNIMKTSYGANTIEQERKPTSTGVASVNKFDALCLLDCDEFTGAET